MERWKFDSSKFLHLALPILFEGIMKLRTDSNTISRARYIELRLIVNHLNIRSRGLKFIDSPLADTCIVALD